MPRPEEALPGRQTPMRVGSAHFVNGHTITPPFPAGMKTAMFGMGCFWGAERKFWQTAGVYSTAVGYAAGMTPNLTWDVRESIQTLTAYIVQVSLGDTPFGSIEYQSIFAVGLLLFAVTLAMNVFSRWFLKRYREEYA